MRTKQCRVARVSLMITITTVVWFSCSPQILAQQWTTNGNDISNTNTGNVGVGTTSPGSKLAVNGRIQQTGSTTDAGYLLTNSSNLTNTSALNPGIAFFGGNGVNALYGADLGFNSTSGRYRTRLFSGNVLADVALGRQENVQINPTQSAFIEFLTIRGDTGFVGIGTATPQFSLDVATPSQFFPGVNIMASTHPTSERASIGFGVNATYTQGWAFGQDRPATGIRDMFLFDVSNNRDVMYWGANGNVGVGTIAPAFKFDVQGGYVNASAGLCIAGDCKTAWSQVNGSVSSVFGRTGAVVPQTGDYTWAQINKNTSSLADIAIRNAGDLSSGTLPNERFPSVLPAVSGANLTALNASNLASGTVPSARLGSGTADSTKFLRGDNTWAVPNSDSQWTTNGNNISNTNTGNVGVGTASPTEKLEVIGNIKVSGNINAKFQDVAEWVDSSQELAAGTVVVLDSSKSNHVIAATQSYDSRVAGVISLRPGLTLGEEAEGRVLVATTGRVKVKVDASDGPIKIGDLLVTSNREGFAMKSRPVELGSVRMHQPGTLIGKALEPLTSGTGEILVLLSLQ